MGVLPMKTETTRCDRCKTEVTNNKRADIGQEWSGKENVQLWFRHLSVDDFKKRIVDLCTECMRALDEVNKEFLAGEQ